MTVMDVALIKRFWRAFCNDATLYPEIKANPGPGWLAVVGLFTPTVLYFLTGVYAGNGLIAFVGLGMGVVTYVLLVGWCWLLGVKLAHGSGTFGQVFRALAYANFLVALLALVPVVWLSGLLGIWAMINLTTAVQGTLGVGRWPAFFIVLSYFAFALVALVFYSAGIVLLQSLAGLA